MSMRLTPLEREQQWREYFTKTGRYADQDADSFEGEPSSCLRPETLIKPQPVNIKELEQKIVKQFIIRFAVAIIALWLLSKLFS